MDTSPTTPFGLLLEERHGGFRCALPRRPRSDRWRIGALLLVLGAVSAGVPAAGIGAVARGMLASGAPWAAFLVLIFVLPFALGGAALAGVAAIIIAGRSEIVVERNEIRTTERIGPFRWTRTRSLGGLVRVEVVADVPPPRFALKAVFEKGKPLWLTIAYPRATVVAVADVLSTYCGSRAGARLVKRSERAVVVEVVEDEQETTTPQPSGPLPAPERTDITIVENPDGITVTVPPAGVWKGSKGLFGFGLMWCGFMTVFTAVGLAMTLGSGPGIGLVLLSLFCLLFWAIGIAMLVGGINMGRRYVIIDVVDDTLLVSRRTLFGVRLHEWTRDQLRDVRFEKSGMEVDGVPIMELQIRGEGSPSLHLLSQRKDDELRWIASVLRAALGIGPV